MIALYPGAFKPPHRGHFNVVKSLLDGSYNGSIYDKDNYKEKGAELFSGNSNKKPDINKVIVFVGAGERNGIDKDEALSIWNVYAKYLGNVEILDGGSNPMFAAKDYAQADPETKFVAVTGIRSEEDFVDLRRVTTFKNAPNVQGLALASKPGSGVRATEFRKNILSGNLDTIIDFFPEDLSREEILNILNDLKDKIVAEILSSNIEGFVEEYFTEENRYNKDGYDEGDIKLMGDMILPTGKMVVLQAEEDTYNRGLLVTSNEDKSYDVAYWADDKTKPYPIGIEIDGKEVAKDANIVKFMFHPEMKEEILDENLNAKVDQIEKTISKIPGVGKLIAGGIDKLQGQVNNIIQTAKEEAGETRDMLIVVGRWLKGETISGENKAFIQRQLLDLLKINATIFGAITKKIPLVGLLGFIIAKLGLTDEVFALSDEDKRTVRGQDDRKTFAGKIKTFNGIKYVPYKDVLPFLKKGEFSVQNESIENKPSLKDYITSLTEYMLDIGMNIQPLPEVKLRKDEAEANNFFGRTAYYDPNAKEIVLYTLGRHDKDIVRSYAHEMIHHIQNLQGELHNINTQDTNADPKLLELEKEAYTLGNITFRNWEDSLKALEENVINEDFSLSPFDFDQDGNETRIKRDINNNKGWRRLGSKSAQNTAIKKYLDKYTSNYKWNNPPKSNKFEEENKKMYQTPYIMYVHLLQTSEGKNNIIEALNGMAVNEPDSTMKQVIQALILVFTDKGDQYKQVYEKYKEIVEKNAQDDNGANPFAAMKYAYTKFNDKVGIFNKFVRNGWSAGQYNL